MEWKLWCRIYFNNGLNLILFTFLFHYLSVTTEWQIREWDKPWGFRMCTSKCWHIGISLFYIHGKLGAKLSSGKCLCQISNIYAHFADLIPACRFCWFFVDHVDLLCLPTESCLGWKWLLCELCFIHSYKFHWCDHMSTISMFFFLLLCHFRRLWPIRHWLCLQALIDTSLRAVDERLVHPCSW